MKFAFCLFNYFPFGGLQRDFLRIARECVRRGHSVDVYTMKWEGERDASLPVTLISVKGWQNHTKAKNFVKQLQPLLASQPYDWVMGFNKMPGLEVYYAADTCYQAKVHKQRRWLYRWLPRYRQGKAYESAVFARTSQTEIFLIAKQQQAEFQHYYHTQAERFHVLPPGISKDRMRPINADEIRENMRRNLNIASNDFLLLMVGSGFKTKGLDRIIRGIASLPDAIKNRSQLFVIGQDTFKPFQRLAEEIGIKDRIRFLGGQKDVPSFLWAADLLLHPAYNENTGTVLLEALVAGLPVLTTDVCGYAHYIKQAKAGEVLPSPFEQRKFNQKLMEMLLSGDLKQERKNGLNFAKNADLYSLPERAVDLLETMTPPLKVDEILKLPGEIFRELENRRTQCVTYHHKNYFVKQHFGIGWKEIFKNLLQGRLPVLGAHNEWKALNRLHELKIAAPKIVGFGSRGINPARQQSFLITEALPATISLEDFCKDWSNNPPPFAIKHQLMREVAHIAKTLHDNGVNHRDFYICHFLLGEQCLYLIDLHRAHVRTKTPRRWQIKDLAGLYFSSKNIGLTQRDLLRFVKMYHARPLREILNSEQKLWKKVKQRGDRLYRKHA
jgi:UDP-glucose:(heptosyl)LPS alpha-1,3-glucosyltransferase